MSSDNCSINELSTKAASSNLLCFTNSALSTYYHKKIGYKFKKSNFYYLYKNNSLATGIDC